MPSEERVALLKELLAANMSYVAIASHLGVTKNAVSGMVFRLGLSDATRRRAMYVQSGIARRKEGAQRRREHAQQRQREIRAEKARRQIERHDDKIMGRIKPVKFTPRKTRAPLLNIPFEALTSFDQCRYSASPEPPFLFCGQPTVDGGSWCEACREIVFAVKPPPQPRRNLHRIFGIRASAGAL